MNPGNTITNENIKYTSSVISDYIGATPIQNKNKVLRYLKSVKPFIYGAFPLKDCITGKVYSSCCANYAKDGWWWSDDDIYYLEHYNIPLKDEFLEMFKD